MVSARFSYTLMTPLFSATKIRPSAANSMLIGFVSPLKTMDSANPDGSASALTSVIVAELRQLAGDATPSANKAEEQASAGGSWAMTETSAPAGSTPRTRTAPTMAAIQRRRRNPDAAIAQCHAPLLDP